MGTCKLKRESKLTSELKVRSSILSAVSYFENLQVIYRTNFIYEDIMTFLKHSWIAVILSFSTLNSLYSEEFLIKPYLQNATTDSISILCLLKSKSTCLVKFGLNKNELDKHEHGSEIGKHTENLYEVKLRNLEQGKEYYYQVDVGGVLSKIYSFRLPKKKSHEEPLSILATSDIQQGASRFQNDIFPFGIKRWVEKHANGDLTKAFDFMLLPGDLVANGKLQDDWKKFFNATHPLLSHVPMYPVLGNHEHYPKTHNGPSLYYDYIVLPENGHHDHPERWWYKDYSNIRVIGLDSNNLGAALSIEQEKWLLKVLDETKDDKYIDFVLAQIHHPHESELNPSAQHTFTGKAIELIANFTNKSGKPTILYHGHAHGYSRGNHKDHGHVIMNVAGGGGNVSNWSDRKATIDYDRYVMSDFQYGFAVTKVTAGASPSISVDWYGRSDDKSYKLNDSVTMRRYNQSPSTPIVKKLFPQDPIELDELGFQLYDYKDPEGDSLMEVEWEISSDSTFNKIINTDWLRNKNIYQKIDLATDKNISRINIASLDLEEDVKYYFRARWRDEALGWSRWSKAQQFSILPPKNLKLLFENSASSKWAKLSGIGHLEFALAKNSSILSLPENKSGKPSRLTFQKELSLPHSTEAVYLHGTTSTLDNSSKASISLMFFDVKGKMIKANIGIESVGQKLNQEYNRLEVPSTAVSMKINISVSHRKKYTGTAKAMIRSLSVYTKKYRE